MFKKYEQLKLENQICFPIYQVVKELIKAYSVYLDPLNLTYTQYLVMMVMWEHEQVAMKQLERLLTLDSNTLTPVITRMQEKGFLVRERSSKDRRKVIIRLTEEGSQLSEKTKDIPMKLYRATGLEEKEIMDLCRIVKKATENLKFSG